ncbi:hypothetical protein TNCV_3855981 [Trichonephila clavipes]|nr:hypothetical protein TNCV_3855981 [Trichonephila clavipes]
MEKGRFLILHHSSDSSYNGWEMVLDSSLPHPVRITPVGGPTSGLYISEASAPVLSPYLQNHILEIPSNHIQA